ncbi:6-O-methylguanine DNA methyltransferase [Phaeosphaeriaceae sp. PMI808]|nr:6-O-methylguanine DNA methyltransferase [Phaeosphaeriaceae sp. PMI808]
MFVLAVSATSLNMAPGERSEEVHLWYTAVYEAIQEIPHGRCTSYGHIARLLGKRERQRQVGVCLKHLPSPSTDPSKKNPTYHSRNVPWQRVINSKGGISPRSVT